MATTKAKKSLMGFGNDIMPGALFAEFLGTFILTAAILTTSGNAIVAAITVLVLVLMTNKLACGYFNPAVVIGLLTAKQISPWRAFGFVIAQILGGMLALVAVTKFMQTGAGAVDAYGMPLQVFKVAEISGQWEPFVAELIGAAIFGLGIGAVVFAKKEGFEAAFTIGGALLLGLVVATLGSASVLNPAVALGVGAYTANWWSILAYTVGPVIGAAAGVWIYKLLQWDVDKANKKK